MRRALGMVMVTDLVLRTLAAAAAEEMVTRFDWSQTGATSGPATVERVTEDRRSALKISNPAGVPTTVSLLVIDRPKIESVRYALTGEVKYEGVSGDASLEMWSTFPEGSGKGSGGRFFTRTLAPMGEMGVLSGSSAWRPFRLPYNSEKSGGPPSRLELNLVLPGAGTVWVSPVQLTQETGGKGGAWWSEREAGVIGGLVGSAGGLIGGLIGWLGSRGRARRFVFALIYTAMGAGAACLAIMVAALVAGQPFHVWGTLLILGLTLLVVFIPANRLARYNYAVHELRKIGSMDAP